MKVRIAYASKDNNKKSAELAKKYWGQSLYRPDACFILRNYSHILLQHGKGARETKHRAVFGWQYSQP
jgi:hypothetical protein